MLKALLHGWKLQLEYLRYKRLHNYAVSHILMTDIYDCAVKCTLYFVHPIRARPSRLQHEFVTGS